MERAFRIILLFNEINSHKEKFIFLTLLNYEGYSLMREFCILSKLIDESYDTLKEFSLNYINPKPNVLTER